MIGIINDTLENVIGVKGLLGTSITVNRINIPQLVIKLRKL
jgi:hypothetical protein